MIDVNLRLIFLAAFVLGLAGFLWWDREKVQRHYILFYRRTKRGLKMVDKVAEKFPRFWKFYGIIGVIIGIGSLVVSVGLFADMLVKIVTTPAVENGPSFIAPGLVSENHFQPGVSFIPVEYWIISIAVLMFVHEMSHAVVARTEGFELNSVGWIILGILPGAFVEPKGEQMLPGGDGDVSSGGHWEGGSWISRLKVLCAGSFANYLTAGLFMLLATAVFAGATTTQTSGYIGINVGLQNNSVTYEAQQGLPAFEAGMRNGTLETVNGQTIDSLEALSNVSEDIKPGENVTVETSEGEFQVTAVERSAKVLKDSFADYRVGLNWFISLLGTIGLLNVLIGLFNMLPIKPLDGGLVTETFIERFIGEEEVEYLNTFSLMGWALLLALMIMSLIGL